MQIPADRNNVNLTKECDCMNKLILSVLTLFCVIALASCSDKTYELPHDQFCYSADGAQTYELNSDDKQYIIDLLNGASWVNDHSNCDSDFVFCTQNQEVRYHSECGTFNDYTNHKSTTISEEQRATINAMLGIN